MESGDYSAGVVLLIRNEVVFILEVVRGRFPFERLKGKVMELKKRYHPSTLLIEESPISLGLIQVLREQSINVTTYKPDTDKRARLIAQTDLSPEDPSVFPGAPDGWKNSLLSCSPFPVATTIRSTPLPKASPGVAGSGVAK